MPITQNTPEQEIIRYMEEQELRLKTLLLRNLLYIGEKCVNKARSTNSYKDQTGNLRSSIGYVIVVDGKVVKTGGFAPSGNGTDRATGQATGDSYARKLAKQYAEGFVLIVVAGMNYAAYVSAKGYDVIDSAELLADQLTDKLLKDLGFK